MYRILARFTILGLIGGGLLMYMAYQEWRLSGTAASAGSPHARRPDRPRP